MSGCLENYFVTAIRHGSHRCWGYFGDLETAKKAVLENWTDLHEEGYYDYLVIEKVGSGIYNFSNLTWWFKVVREEGHLFIEEMKEEPDFAVGYVGWCF